MMGSVLLIDIRYLRYGRMGTGSYERALLTTLSCEATNLAQGKSGKSEQATASLQKKRNSYVLCISHKLNYYA